MTNSEYSNPTEIKSLRQMLIEGAFVTSDEVEQAEDTAQRSGKKLIQVLLEQQLVTSETMATILSLQHNIPVIDLRHFFVQPQALTLVPEKVAREYKVLPIQVDGDSLTVAMEDAGNIEAINAISAITMKKINPTNTQ